MYLLQIFKLNAKFFCILPVFPCLHLDPFCTPLPGYLPGSTTLFFVFGFLLDFYAATGMSHLFLSIFSPPFPLLTVLWVFLDVNAAYHTGSCLQ